MFKVVCPYCGQVAVLVDSSIVYGRSFGLIYLCAPCDAYVGTHKGSPRHAPLGTLANKELREARLKAHKILDPLWKSGKMTRNKAYRALNRILSEAGYQIPKAKGHIGMLNREQCEALILGLQGHE